MDDQRALEIWSKILEVLDDKLQYGFLEQAKSVMNVTFDGTVFTLFVAGEEEQRFFSAEINQQRLFIVSRPIASVTRFAIEKVELTPV